MSHTILSKRPGALHWLAVSLLSCALAAPAGSAARTVETDWCTITQPDAIVPGTPVEIAVAIKPGAGTVVQGVQLACHLQWAKKEGYGGFLSWQPARDAKPGETYRFRHGVKLDLDTMTGIMPIVFLAPGGDFEKRTEFVTLPVIPITVTAELRAKLAEEARLAAERAAAIARPATAKLKRSMLRIVPEAKTVTKGDAFTVSVEYVLDASDHWGDGTQVELIPLGPWVDNPDGTYTKSRSHHGYPGLGNRRAAIEPGKGTKEFSFTLGGTFRYNELQWMAQFIGGDGKAWPWSVRGGGPTIERFVEGFDLTVPAEGGLFVGEERPRAELVWGASMTPGAAVEAAFRLVDTRGATVAEFRQTFTVGTRGERAAVALPPFRERGVLLLLATIQGTTRDAFLARIPDVAAIVGNRCTPFGVTNVGDPALSRVARRLGATYCRQFTGWAGLEPLPGQWRFDGLDKSIAANRDAGILPWICLVGPPAWAMADPHYSAGYEPFTFKADAWRDTVQTLATRYRGVIWGFEWLNEIVPGNKTREPVAEYLDFCRIGTDVVRTVDPAMKVQLAGGLWPRNFRTDLLNAGVGDAIDVLPIHYGGETAIREARHDVAAVGKAKSVTVWDNETARGLSVWKMPPEEALVRSVVQSKWMMRQWPAELTAGAEGIVYFGGHVAAAGNWSYLLDATTPRPAAATFAVLAAQLGTARPVATAYPSPDTVLHLFEKSGRGLAVVATVSDADDASARLTLATGAQRLVETDHQGNQRTIASGNGAVETTAAAMPVILDGFDWPTLAVHAGLEIGTQGPSPSPSATIVRGADAAEITLRVVNPLDKPVKGRVTVALDSGIAFPVREVDLAPGADALLHLPLASATAPVGAALEGAGTAELRWTSPADVACRKPFRLVAIDPRSLGNLLANGDLEAVAGAKPAAWTGEAESVELATLGAGPGFEGRAARFSGAKSANYQHANQVIALPAPGRQYLYTAWVWNHDMQAGSNLSVDDQTYFIPSVFDAGHSTSFWRLMTHVRSTPENAARMTLTPVVRGKGWALYDNVRVTLYEGTSYAAEARRATCTPSIDGDLGDWDFADPIPLLCDNQVTAPDGYAWTPANLSGIARFAWDGQALYFAARVRDDRHVADKTGEETLQGDSLVLALHPGNRVEGTDARAFAWHLGAAAPGGGSGKHTLYRPPTRSGGLASGQLAKDSSVYEVAIVREGDITAYELRIPWSETGGLTPALGVKAGLSLQLRDVDVAGHATAAMTWGGGLRPAWSPSGFGVLTLTE